MHCGMDRVAQRTTRWTGAALVAVAAAVALEAVFGAEELRVAATLAFLPVVLFAAAVVWQRWRGGVGWRGVR